MELTQEQSGVSGSSQEHSRCGITEQVRGFAKQSGEALGRLQNLHPRFKSGRRLQIFLGNLETHPEAGTAIGP